MMYEDDYLHLRNFYERQTKCCMEQGESNILVLGYYKGALQSNSMLDWPKDLGELELLMCRYLKEERE